MMPISVIFMAYISKNVIDALVSSGSGDIIRGELLLLLILLFLIAISRHIMQRLMDYCQSMHDEILSGSLSTNIMEHMLSADLEYFDNPTYHDKLVAADSDSHAISYITWNVLSGAGAILSFFSVFVVLAQARLVFGFIVLAASLPASIISAKYTKLLYALSLEQVNGLRQMGYHRGVATSRTHAQEMRLYNAGGKLIERYRSIWYSLFIKRRNVTFKRTFVTTLLGCLPEVAVLIIGIDISFGVLAGRATVGDYSLYISLAAQLLTAITVLSSSIINIYDNQMKIENFKGIKKFVCHVTDSGIEKLSCVETITFEDVCFSYPSALNRAINNVSFHIGRGEKVAFVGLNGSGKTTLIKLLLRMYDPDSGTIYINGTDIKEYKLTSLRSNFSVYFQDVQNYCFTLRENLTIADDTHPEHEKAVNDALSAADCSDLLDWSCNGLDVNISRLFSDDGIELSGGQHQKLALARTLYRRHTALVLDEPSSSLDPKSEYKVFESLKHFTEGRTTLFTSHRLSNVFLADRIIVMERGSVIEDGSQEELLRSKHRFAELFGYQQRKYQTSDS